MSQGASQVAWHVAPCWSMITRVGEGRHHSNYFCSAEALSEKKKKKRKPREHKQRHSPTALSPHCQETGLGLYSMGEGGRGGRGEGGAQRRSKDGTRSSIWRDEGPKPSRCALAACNVSAWLSAKPTVASAAQKYTLNFQQSCSDVDLSFTLLNSAVNSLISELWQSSCI